MKNKDKILKKGSDTLEEFKKFISKGNIIDMAVGVVIGSSFSKIVSSLVENIIMPLVGIIIGKIDFSKLMIIVGNAQIKYGIFIQNIIDFLIIAICIFIVIKIFAKFKKKEEQQETIKLDENTELLREIRDLLKTK